jgi:SAM-dependent methyltransferase
MKVRYALSDPFQAHDLLWDEQKINRFWEYASSCQSWQEGYFSLQVGAGVVSLARSLTPLSGRILDFGCGPGHLVDHLLAAGIPCEGADISASAIKGLDHRLQAHPHWRGGHHLEGDRIPLEDESLDVVFFVETIEHLLPEALDRTLRELRRVLKPGSGRIFLTTPHAEDLDRAKVFCPECGSVFHRYQHIGSFSRNSLQSSMEKFGFRTLECDATNFSRFQKPGPISPFDWTPRYLARTLLRALATLENAISLPGRPVGTFHRHCCVGSGQHLFYLGQRI